jgi:hypothetical protein
MKIGTLYTRIITRKLQAIGSGSDLQFILLGGFEPQLTQAKAAYYETLSPGHVLKQEEIDATSARMQRLASASEVKDCTDASVRKRLDKLLEENKYTFL